MTPGQLKGTLLEYLVRRLLENCGFNSVRPDGHYIYEQNGTGLFFINGKGAAHDADVLMEPPIQMPFSYPSRVLFECKSYRKNVGLGVIRNALGLRYDINEFEIVTDDSIQKRKNNRRANYAISDRKRYNYQVGVAAVKPFSSAAFEFAANNKIPLLSLSWLLPTTVCDLFHLINQTYLNSISQPLRNILYQALKDKGNLFDRDNDVQEFISHDDVIGQILRSFDSTINNCFIGLIETGDLIFLFSNVTDENQRHRFSKNGLPMRAQIHYYRNEPNRWTLSLRGDSNSQTSDFTFFVPDRIMRIWQEFSLDKAVAIDLKERFFSRIFIFTRTVDRRRLPFIMANIDQAWLNEIREE